MYSLIRYTCFLLVWLCGMEASFAQARLNRLDIAVQILDNGDAQVTEVRDMHINDNGTELYIPIANLNGRTISNLGVTDNLSDTPYTFTADWDVDWSRSRKANRCGIVNKRDGYELCWGLGESGDKTYTTGYRIHNLVQRYDTCDGFLWMFVNPGIRPLPQEVSLRIRAFRKDSLGRTLPVISSANTRIWAFGCDGAIGFDSLGITMQSNAAFGESSRLIMLCQFEKGLFQPTQEGPTSWETLKEGAMEGSDYGKEDWADRLIGIILMVGMAIMILLPVAVFIYRLVRRRLDAHAIKKEATYWRDPVFKGSLMQTNAGYNYLHLFASDHDNLLSSFILKMLYRGDLKIVKITDPKGKTSEAIAVNATEPESDGDPDFDIYLRTWKIFRDAAGSDLILQNKELSQFMSRKANLNRMLSYKKAISKYDDRNHAWVKEHWQDMVRLQGYTNFLKDFTLVDEREIQEVALWKDYLIYATLFGMGKEVLKKMKQINPEYLEMDTVAQALQQTEIVPVFCNTFHRSYSGITPPVETRSSGGGGSISFGGGGGFSGGGFGGGIR